ncbi:MAG: hypothetical protein GX652_09730 [Burkholderiaceae bacterium]|nr:hypothetical protein [Burkholderiaceae bacterium]
MTTPSLRKRLEHLEGTAPPPQGALTIEEKAAAIVQVLDSRGLARLPRPDTAAALTRVIPPPDGVDWNVWWRALAAALTAAHAQ